MLLWCTDTVNVLALLSLILPVLPQSWDFIFLISRVESTWCARFLWSQQICFLRFIRHLEPLLEQNSTNYSGIYHYSFTRLKTVWGNLSHCFYCLNVVKSLPSWMSDSHCDNLPPKFFYTYSLSNLKRFSNWRNIHFALRAHNKHSIQC